MRNLTCRLGSRPVLEAQTACTRVLGFMCGQSQEEERVVQGRLIELGRSECVAMRLSLNEPVNIDC